jgi:hypothetical protein
MENYKADESYTQELTNVLQDILGIRQSENHTKHGSKALRFNGKKEKQSMTQNETEGIEIG